MGFETIRFSGFRNLEDGEVDVNAYEIYLIGKNGQGKTNFLESLYLLSYGSSFRTRIDKDIVSHERKDMAVHGKFSTGNEKFGQLSYIWKNGNKIIKVNGKIISDRKNLINKLPVIVFVHDDFLFVSGPPEKRRWFVDQTLSLHDPLYVDQLRRYKKLLKERNYLLKTRQFSLLDHYSEQLAFSGLGVSEKRKSLLNEFNKIFTPLYREISGIKEKISFIYKPSWGNARTSDEVMNIFYEKKEMDAALGMTGTGPHRDKFIFSVNGKDFVKTASTGQQRLLSLVLRVAQAQFYTSTTGKKPVLLLDDVLLELDPEKRNLFREKLPESEQIFYTFLPGEKTEKKDNDYITYRVINGKFHVG